ncbi:FAD-dependent monooxygenase [Micromonospora sp. NPDC051006]|uniref:FAD-dependent monooxygenase n=1 Tax=Micromonospora sp. NPDC051006 TaxID=3364283 RepID=UPI0037872862
MNAVEVLVVGAGPTGLALAGQLASFGVQVRLVDRALDRVHESRALAIQPRTLEVLAGLGVTDELVASGNRAVRLCLHAGRREREVPLFDLGLHDSMYPYLLFLSQAETERVLAERSAAMGVSVQRGVELVGLEQSTDNVVASLRYQDGHEEQVSARYVVGCDGAHSTVRQLAGIEFEGASYPQTFVLADLEADGVAEGAAHAFLSAHGMLFLFPLGHPATWRLLAMRPPTNLPAADAPLTLDEVQHLADTYTGATVRLRDPVWMTNFRLHHRAATRYRKGRLFLAGDAAHIHSPAGAQGMNTGIQDAVNLGWKLAQALRSRVAPTLLDTYETERAPVGRLVLRFTDRAFTVATSTSPAIRFARTHIAPALIPAVLGPKTVRRRAFRTMSQLAINYRQSLLSLNGSRTRGVGPRAGDRLPDARLPDGGTLHQLTATPGWHLLLCGPAPAWDTGTVAALNQKIAGWLTVHRLTGTGDAVSLALRRLGLASGATGQYLIRPDGHIGYRSDGTNLTGLIAYLNQWLPV